MKKFIYLTLFALFSILGSGCGRATQRPIEATPNLSEQMINPGDKIGDFLITTGEGKDIIFVTKSIVLMITRRVQSLVNNL